MVARKPDWPIQLSKYLEEHRNTPFEWGAYDCVMFGAKGLERLTGRNFYAMYEGYTTEEDAKQIIENAGGIEALISKHLGPGFRNYKQAKRGDLVMAKMPQKTIGIVDDSGSRIACMGPNGVVRVPLTKAWRVWSY